MGTIKLILALSVLFSHIGNFEGMHLFPAEVAVNCFFIISGFYMTLGLSERYLTPDTNYQFYLGRFFRIWPTYFISLLILMPWGSLRRSILLMMDLPLPMEALALFSNFTMFGLDILTHISGVDGHVVFSEYGIDPNQNGAKFILNTSAWSLSLELLFYLIAPFVVRSFKKSLIFITIGLAYCFYIKHINTTLPDKYRTDIYFPNAMAYFGLGILGYWLNRLYPISRPKNWGYYFSLAGVAFISLWVSPVIFVGFITLAIFSRLLFDLSKKSKIDKFLGDLAFPIYILQIPVGAMVRAIGVLELNTFSYFIATITISLIVLLVVERPIEKLRVRLYRGKKRADSNDHAVENMHSLQPQAGSVGI
ncbi:acyltransferase [Undibacterium sp. RTI2.2]|uniref:acyltransferase family protein n=1 Tax=unclassified Undibacterium TaxID=2630295 RepID=UPI002AB45D75|nr:MULTISPECIES: acyltransferase [unclassified Undibacterium]MDY7539962.1 acyltransferase [Undibacterium sp. 5I1]MEB0116473.1 acyltransferase [Undibacterium sp. RTI2.2]MEB0232718.1 acyltransferase [Undibacterium sp. 10I3]MEB0257267.1 acyltransferase [Undibacterium sp. 5I1]